MSTIHTLIESPFATPAEAKAYDRWLSEKIQASLDDTRPTILHDEVMARMQELIEAKRRLLPAAPSVR